MGVKVTGQFEPAGDFSIVDGADVSGNITGSNISSSGEIEAGSIGTNLASIISGSTPFDATAVSGSLGTNATLIRSLTATGISGSFTTVSSSISTRLTTEESNVDTLQSTMTSEQSNIDNLQTDSGSFSTRVTALKTDSGSFSTRITTAESELGNTLISGSAQIASDISGSWQGSIDISTDTNLVGGTNITLSGDTLNVDDAFLINDGSDTTTGTITAGGFTTTATASIGRADISGDLTVAGNYTVNGTTTFISSSQLDIGDNIIQVNSVNPVRYGGIQVKDVNSGQTGSMVWDSSNDYWVAGQSGSEYRVPIQSSTSALTDNKVIIAQGNGRIESGNITDNGSNITISLPITASSNLEVAGNVSGSSTSTGSFARGIIADTLEVGSTYGTAPAIKSNNGIDLGVAGASNSKLRFSGDDIMIRGDGSGNMTFHANTDFIFKHSNGQHKLVVDATKVSGSSASTGSFGAGYIDNKLGLGIKAPISPLHIYQDNSTTDTTNGITIENDGTGDAILQYLLTGTKRWITGIDNSDSDKFKFVHGVSDIGSATPPLTLTADNQVGINDSTPGNTLAVEGGVYVSGYVTASSGVSGSSTSTGSFGHGYIDSKLGIGTLSPSKHIHIYGSGQRNMFIQSTDGLARFELEGATQSDIIMKDTGGGSGAKHIQLAILDNLFKIRTLTDAGDVGNEMMNFDLTNNRIGIGTTSPTEALTVTGDISASGDFHLDGQAGFGSAPNTNYAATFQQPTGTNKDYIQGIQDNGSNVAFRIDTDSGDNVSLRLYNGSGAQKIHLNAVGTSTFEGSVSGSATSTGSFGRLTVGDSGNVTETYKVNITGDKGLYINHTGGAWDAQGIRLDTSATSGRGATLYGDDFTNGALVWLETNSSNTGEHYALNILQNHASAVNSIPLRVTQDADGMAAVFQGGEGKTGKVGIYADEGDDNADKWMFEATTGAQFQLRSYQPGSWATSFLVDQANTKFHIYENLDLSSGDFDVSGSSTSTGSFGAGYIDNKLGIGTTAPERILHLKTGTNGQSQITMENDAIKYHFGVNSDDNFNLYNATSARTDIQVTTAGHTIFGGNVSGSSTSTGSFGLAKVDRLRFTGDTTGDTKTGISLNANHQVAITLNNSNNYVFAATEFYTSNGVRILNETPSATNPVFTINGYDDGLGGASNTAALITNSLPRVVAYDSGVEFPTANGKISGSSTSTGSFGALRVDDTSFNVSADRVGVGTSPVATSKMHIYGQSGAGTEVLHLQHGTYGTLELAHGSPAYGSGKLAIHSTGDLAIGGAGTTLNLGMGSTVMAVLNSTTGMEVKVGNISGSSTSTGSFGVVHAEGIRGLNGTYGGTLFVPEQLALGNDTDTMIRKYTGNVLEFRMGGVDVARFDGNNAKFIVEGAGGVEVESGNIVSTKTNGLISGSATSTGSFGRIEGTTVSASNYVGQIGSRYVHSQTSDSATWTINHNIGSQYPVVTVYDTDNAMMLPETGTATDSDTFTLTFNEAIQGKAVVSVGGIGENAGANYIYTQGSSTTNWRVTHSLSQQYPNITVFDENDQVIIPETITATSDNHTDIVFSDGQSGYANFSIGSGIPNISAENAGKVLKVRSGGQGVEWSATSSDVSGSMSVSGSITPTIDNFHNLGSATHRWANLYTGDIELSNEGSEGNEVDGTTGSWTIQEGEDDLYLLNRKNGKKYKFKLEEIT